MTELKKLIAVLVREMLKEDCINDFYGSNLSSGIYFYIAREVF
jgi:hypothetical protein